MFFNRWLLTLILLYPVCALGQQADPKTDGAKSSPTSGSDVIKALEEVELSMAMARDGQYGRIRGRDMKRLEAAYAHIVETLGGIGSLTELNPQERQSLALAQSQFDGILQPEDGDRKICKRIASTGTRLGALECLTLAERRARAEASREMVKETQRGFCIPGEGNACGG